MFRCEMCGNVTKPKEKQHKKIIKTREKNYTYLDEYGNKKISKGTEIVKEINICEKCYEERLRK